MWQRFSERARKVVFYAQEEAQRWGQNYVSTEHLLLGLVREPDNLASIVLEGFGVSAANIKQSVDDQLEHGAQRPSQDMTLTPRAKRVIDCAYDEARNLNNNYIGTEHLLLGLIREGDGIAGRSLARLGVELEKTRKAVMDLQGQEEAAGAGRPKMVTTAAVDKWGEYSSSGKAAIYRAFAEKAKYEHPVVSAEHFLLAIVGDMDTTAAKVLAELGATPELIRQGLEREFKSQAEKKEE